MLKLSNSANHFVYCRIVLLNDFNLNMVLTPEDSEYNVALENRFGTVRISPPTAPFFEILIPETSPGPIGIKTV